MTELEARYPVGDRRIVLVEGDITRQEVDAIVNAANSGLRGGGGVDGAIHRAGGPSILEECREIGGCPTGEAVVTGAGELPCDHVIHAVGPRWRGGDREEDRLLASAYRESLARAEELGVATLTFPSLSTGAYGFPMARAARIGLETVADGLQDADSVREVRFVLFGQDAFSTFRTAADEVLGS